MISARLRTRVRPEELEPKVGKILGPEDYNLLITGPAKLIMPSGRPLCVYLPGVLAPELDKPGIYEILHGLRQFVTDNRGAASGSKRIHVTYGPNRNGEPRRTRARRVPSTIIGAIDPSHAHPYCRLTAWTGRNLPEWQALQPLLQVVATRLQQYVPDRFEAQMQAASASNPAWVVPGTPFSTVTVNNTWPTGTHTDSGDLDAGFSTIAVLRRGEYTGGHLVFPEYRVAVDMHHGDLLMMDAHQWHANTALVCACGTQPNGSCKVCGAERISVVSYFRTEVAHCGSPAEEIRKGDRLAK